MSPTCGVGLSTVLVTLTLVTLGWTTVCVESVLSTVPPAGVLPVAVAVLSTFPALTSAAVIT